MDVKIKVGLISAISAIIVAAITVLPINFIDPDIATVTIQGIVVDKDNIPVIGVIVNIDGQSKRTDNNGKYIIQDVTEGIKTIKVNKGEIDYQESIIVRNNNKIMIHDVVLPAISPTTPTLTPTPTTTPTPTLTPTPTSTQEEQYTWDTNHDGDVYMWDTNYDGYVDMWDTNYDGYVDVWDTDYDGYPDAWDTDYDGYVDTWL